MREIDMKSKLTNPCRVGGQVASPTKSHVYLQFLTPTLCLCLWLSFYLFFLTFQNSPFSSILHSVASGKSLIPKMPSSLQLQSPTFRALHLHRLPVSSFWGSDLCSYNTGGGVALNLDAAAPAKHNNRKKKKKKKENLLCSYGGTFRVFAMSNASPPPSFKMNLNEYMVTLEKPLGIRFALSVHGKVFVHALKKGVFPSFFFLYSVLAPPYSRNSCHD